MGIRVEEPGSKELMFQETPMAFKGKVHGAYSEGLIAESDAECLLPGFRTSTDSPTRLSSIEIKRLLSLSGEERDKKLEASAQAAIEAYAESEANSSGLSDDIVEHS